MTLHLKKGNCYDRRTQDRPASAIFNTVVRKECQHLTTTDRRLFADTFTLTQAARLEADAELAERVEAFVGRFGRLQDTVGDKLLPLLLGALGEKTSAASTTLIVPNVWVCSSLLTNG